ncbi:MAG TPA: T9SS type A sorting domain-containing protein [Puia sp.]|nr:T9SS type A sorting domain-containing protein [Puia sp.]
MKNLLCVLAICQLLTLTVFSGSAQTLTPFDHCPGASVAITKPGFNLTPGAYQIYLIDSTGKVTPSGNPINLQINGLGLNGADGFLYGIHETSNLANPFLARADRNGNYEDVGTLPAPPVDAFNIGLVNTAAGTMDDKDNFYFIALSINLQNVLDVPQLYVGKVESVSGLQKSDQPLTVKYTKINPGTCLLQLLAGLAANPLEGVLQDIAYNPSDGNIYTYLPTSTSSASSPGKIAWFNADNNPIFTCIDPPQSNPSTTDLSGLYFGQDTALYILTTDGKFYKGDPHTGVTQAIGQSGLPLLGGNLRGDMASCVGKKQLVAFENCPGVSVAITRPGINATVSPYQIYLIDNNGNVQPSGNPINNQFNGFGLNAKDGFLYGMHESSNLIDPFFSRMDKNGDFVDIGKLTGPPGQGYNVHIINTAAGTMDGRDNFYFTAVLADTPLSIFHLPKLFLGTIQNVSQLKPGDPITVDYKEILIGSCADEILSVLSNPTDGLLQDIAYNPNNGYIYTIIPARGGEPARAKIAHFNPGAKFPQLNCINPQQPNPSMQDLSGIYTTENGRLFILTIDGKLYRGNVQTGNIRLVGQTGLPLQGGNLRGDMASCVGRDGRKFHDNGDDDDDDNNQGNNPQNAGLRIVPNPVYGDQVNVEIRYLRNSSAQLKIMNATGTVVISKSIELSPGVNRVRINVSDLQAGYYFLSVSNASGFRLSQKFLRL